MKVVYEVLTDVNNKWDCKEAVLKTIEDYEKFLSELCANYCVSINALYADEKGAEE